MFRAFTAVVLAAVFALSACGDTDLERGLTGAAAGGITAEALGGDFATGAVVGGAAGVVCDDVNIC